MKFHLLVAASALAVGLSLSGTAFAWEGGSGGSSGGSTPTVSAAVAASVQAGEVEGNKTEIGGKDVDLGSKSWFGSNPANQVDDNAFQNAQGLFNVQQNAAQNSLQQADNTLGAILNCGCSTSGTGIHGALALSAQVASVEHNRTEIHGRYVDVAANNRVNDYAFQNATGLFNVQQNTGNNSMQQASNTVAAITGSSLP